MRRMLSALCVVLPPAGAALAVAAVASLGVAAVRIVAPKALARCDTFASAASECVGLVKVLRVCESVRDDVVRVPIVAAAAARAHTAVGVVANVLDRTHVSTLTGRAAAGAVGSASSAAAWVGALLPWPRRAAATVAVKALEDEHVEDVEDQGAADDGGEEGIDAISRAGLQPHRGIRAY